MERSIVLYGMLDERNVSHRLARSKRINRGIVMKACSIAIVSELDWKGKIINFIRQHPRRVYFAKCQTMALIVFEKFHRATERNRG